MIRLDKHPLLRQCYDVMQAIEVCGCSKELTHAVTLAGALLHAINALCDERDALKADAERYRWLRNDALYAGYGYKKEMPWVVIGTSHLDCHPVSGEELDAAIDAERAEK